MSRPQEGPLTGEDCQVWALRLLTAVAAEPTYTEGYAAAERLLAELDDHDAREVALALATAPRFALLDPLAARRSSLDLVLLQTTWAWSDEPEDRP